MIGSLRMRLCLLAGLLLGTLLLGCGEGRPTQAEEAAEAAREALGVGAFERALALAQEAESLGGERFTAYRYFIRGNVAWAASLEWERAAAEGDGEAGKFAYQQAEDALAYWQMAASSRLRWPAARRNVERGLLRMRSLREKKNEREKPPETDTTPDPAETEADEEDPEASEALIEMGDLPSARVGALLEVLLQREARKRALREAQRKERSRRVERDW